MAAEPAHSDRDYVLGTHDAEIERLRFQNDIWRDEVARAWRTAALARGARVVDVGAGPGFASLDLAEQVGPAGEVVAVERSGRFVRLLAAEAARRGIAQIRTAELDLMAEPIPAAGADLVWCRWVACFVHDPGLLVDRIAACLRSGGRAVFHEYVEYASYRLLPVQPAFTGFVEAVYESWRHEGGEPDIARALPTLLSARGFRIDSTRPIAYAARPGERLWEWPAGFARINARRLAESGRRDEAWARAVTDAVEAAERDPASVFMTPTVLEIIATKR